MTSDDNQRHPDKQTPSTSFKLLKPLASLSSVLLIALVSGLSGYLLGFITSQNVPQATQIESFQPSPTAIGYALGFRPKTARIPTVKPIPSPDPYDVSIWATFTSPMERFIIRYPHNWIVEDNTSRNCGYNAAGYNSGVPTYNSGTPTSYDYCRDSFDFISPDGKASVRYVLYRDDTDDKQDCGVHGPCPDQIFDAVEELTTNHLGKLFLVQCGREISLHKPADGGTIPVLGNNIHITDNPGTPYKKEGYIIWLSLPSKTGGRFSLSLNLSRDSRVKLTDDQSYNEESVNQAILILKSLHY